MRSQPPLFSTRRRKGSCISERFFTIFRLSATPIPTFGRSSVYHFCVKTVIGHLYSFWRCYYWIVMSASLDQVRSHAPSLGMWDGYLHDTYCAKKDGFPVSSWMMLSLTRVVCLVVWSYTCSVLKTVFFSWNVAMSFGWKGDGVAFTCK